MAVGLIVYAWVLFPLLLRVAAGSRPAHAVPKTSDDLPRVAVLFSAFNEETHIAERIRNLLELDYPSDRITFYVGIDGSSDGTYAQAVHAAGDDPRVRIHGFDENRGKVAVLRELVAAVDGAAGEGDGDVLVFTDANTQFAPDAVRRMVSHFQDPAVGGVCGRLVFVDHAGVATDEGIYWQWENRLKKRESALDSCLGANGAIYAIRRELFWRDIPANTIIDDFVIGMKVRERGFRVLYDPRAVACEELPETVRDEWGRRVRIGSGGFQALVSCRACLAPRYGVFAWFFWSHKVFRWVTSHLLAAALLFAAPLSQTGEGWMQGVAAGTLLSLSFFTLVATVGHWLGAGSSRSASLVRPFTYFCVINAALFAGSVRFFRGGLAGTWSRTARTRTGCV